MNHGDSISKPIQTQWNCTVPPYITMIGTQQQTIADAANLRKINEARATAESLKINLLAKAEGEAESILGETKYLLCKCISRFSFHH